MGKSKIFYYIVEGENEKKLVETIKEKGYIPSGKIRVFNIIHYKISTTFLRTLDSNTTVVLIFDTDVAKLDIFEENIKLILKNKNVKDIIFIPQILCIEDELVYSTDIKKIEELLDSKSKREFKADFNNCSNLLEKLLKKGFDINKIWSRNSDGEFSKYQNSSQKIKKRH